TFAALLDEYRTGSATSLAVPQGRDAAIEALRGNDAVRRQFRPEQVPRLVDLYVRQDRIEWEYRPRTKGLRGDVLLLIPTRDPGADARAVHDSWTPFIHGRIEQHLVDSSTEDMLSADSAAVVGRVLSAWLLEGAPRNAK